MEQAILKCDQEKHPDLIFIEGQSSLRNPAGPCGAEFICSAQAKYVILQHDPKRRYFLAKNKRHTFPIPSLDEEIRLIEQYGAKVIAVTINTQSIAEDELLPLKKELTEKINRPVIYPRIEGVESLLPLLTSLSHYEHR